MLCMHTQARGAQLFSTRSDAREMCKLLLYAASPDRRDTLAQLANSDDELDRPSYSVCRAHNTQHNTAQKAKKSNEQTDRHRKC